MNKIYVISNTYSPGSAVTNHALSIVRGLCENGCKVEWVFLLPGGKMERVEKIFDGLTVKYLWSKKLSKGKILKHLYKQLSYGYFFLHTLKRGDVVILMGMSAYVSELASRNGIKVFHEKTEHPDAVPDVRYSFFLKGYFKACKKLDGIFVISNALKEYFISLGVPENKVTVVNMVVDSNRFMGIEKQNAVEPYIAYCGNASNSKDGVDDLIKAFGILANSLSNVKLMIIGPAPTEDSDNSILVDKLGLKNRVIFRGCVPPNEMPLLLKNASVLALARPDSIQNKYGFPTKLGEYLLTGNPVCVTRVGDIPMFLEHKKSALLSDCGNIQGFADNLIWSLTHLEESSLIGENGKKIAEKYFNYLIESKKMIEAITVSLSNNSNN